MAVAAVPETDEEEAEETTPQAGTTGDEEPEPTTEGGDEEEQIAAAAKPPKLLQEPLPGDWDSISAAFGGVDPDVAEIRLLGGKMPIDGSFAKGTEIDLHVRVRITGVLGQDLEDAYGTKQHTVRRHMARMISVRRLKT